MAIPPGAVALQVSPFAQTIANFIYNTGGQTRQRTVIRDQSAWESFWANATKNFTNPPAVPSVDFAQEMVIVAAMGGRPTGGYSIAIESAHEAGATVYVTVREISPGANCVVTQAGTSPVTAARVPRRDGTVLFIERSETRDC